METIFETYEKTTYSNARKLLADRFAADSDKSAALPPLDDIRTRRGFDQDDHWQKGNGFIGQLPEGESAAARTETLKRGFSPEDVISEVLDTHLQNVLGNDPAISIESLDSKEGEELSQELLDLLDVVKEWFDQRNNTDILADAVRGARRESASVLRAFIPSGMIDGAGKISAKDLKEALSKIWIRHEHIDTAGVLVDEATATELGLVMYRMDIEGTPVSLTEYAYVDEEGMTVWGTASAHTESKGSEVAEPLKLNGHLPIYQLNAKSLITTSVCQAQRAINLSGTMLTRNNNLAGSRERLAIGVMPAGQYEDKIQPDGSNKKTFVPTEMKTGPGMMNFLSAQAVFDDQGLVKALANPNVIFTDPVPIDTFVGTSAHWRKVIYSKAKMLHLLMSDDATASGRSRIEARKEFQASLNESKQIADAAGKWMIEVALNIAAHFIGSPGAFLNVVAKFDSQISTIELTAEEITQIREDFEAGLIDLRTALELRGFKNVDEIIERMEGEEQPDKTLTKAKRLPNEKKEE